MSRVAIFMDGGYIDKVLREEFNNASIDYQALSIHIARCIDHRIDILRTYYYHCLPYKGNPPTEEEAARFGRMQNFFDALRRLPRFDVREGRLARRGPDQSGHYSFEQKMVDTLLSIDLVRHSTKSHITHAALVVGDSDFVPAIKVARDEGVSVWLFHGGRVHNELWDAADERVRLTQDVIDKVLWRRREPKGI